MALHAEKNERFRRFFAETSKLKTFWFVHFFEAIVNKRKSPNGGRDRSDFVKPDIRLRFPGAPS
jgi:hypothetical protein